MSIRVDASVIVADDPMPMEVRPGEPGLTAVMVAGQGVGTYASQQVDLSELVFGEMLCRGDLAAPALALHRGDRARVIGHLGLSAALDYPNDGTVYVRLTITAESLVAE